MVTAVTMKLTEMTMEFTRVTTEFTRVTTEFTRVTMEFTEMTISGARRVDRASRGGRRSPCRQQVAWFTEQG